MQLVRERIRGIPQIAKNLCQQKVKHPDLRSSLLPLQRVSQLLGLNLTSVPGRIYTWLVFLSFSAIVYGSSVHLCTLECSTDKIGTFVLWMQYVANCALVFVVAGKSLFIPDQFCFPHRDLAVIDASLKSCGGKFPKSNLIKIQLLQIFLSLSIPFMFGFRDIRKSVDLSSYHMFLYWFHYCYSVNISITTDCLFVNYLSIIGGRFRELNKLMSKMGGEKSLLTVTPLGISDFNIFHDSQSTALWRMQTFRRIHHNLCTLSMRVNVNFGAQLLVNSAISFIIITGQLYETYHTLDTDQQDAEHLVYNSLWIMFYMSRLVYVSRACYQTRREARLTAIILHEISVQRKPRDVQNELIHDKLTFTACGFFDIDFNMLCSIVGAVTTYLVILIQMDSNRESLANGKRCSMNAT